MLRLLRVREAARLTGIAESTWRAWILKLERRLTFQLEQSSAGTMGCRVGCLRRARRREWIPIRTEMTECYSGRYNHFSIRSL
jgi:hypothetical protein